MKRSTSRRTHNSLSSLEAEDVEALGSSQSSCGQFQSCSEAISSAVASQPVASSSSSLAVNSQRDAVPSSILLPPTASSQPASLIQIVSDVVRSSSATMSSSVIHRPTMSHLPYRPSLPWPIASVPSFSPSPLLYSSPASLSSPLVQPPSLFSSHSLPPPQAVHAAAALDSIVQPAPVPEVLNQFLAITSELVPSQARTAALTQESLSLRARLQQSTSAIPPGIASQSIPTHPVLAPAGTVHTQLFGVSPLKQQFVVGPGFPPIPPKVVASVVGGEYINLGVLIQKPSESRVSEPSISFEGRVIVSNAPKPPRRITDLALWSQAFNIYCLILVTYHPHRALDLLRYHLLILRLASQFPALVWCDYDEAFRRDAAARHITDWSSMHVELFNFHSAAAFARSGSSRSQAGSDKPGRPAPRGAPIASAICHSWNAGHCSSPRNVCRYVHVCSVPSCHGSHRRTDCPRLTGGQFAPRMLPDASGQSLH